MTSKLDLSVLDLSVISLSMTGLACVIANVISGVCTSFDSPLSISLFMIGAIAILASKCIRIYQALSDVEQREVGKVSGKQDVNVQPDSKMDKAQYSQNLDNTVRV